jgi:hypothetical protein
MSLPEHSILQVVGQEGKTMEFDIDPDREMVKMTLGKESIKFKFIDMWAMIYAASGPEQQEKMTPVRQTEVMTYRRIHNYKLKKAQPAGVVLRIPCEINVEKTVVEGLRGMVEQQKKSVSGLPIIGHTKYKGNG